MADDAGRINPLLSETTFLYGGNADYVEELYTRFAADPAAVPASWRAYFEAFGERAADIEAAAHEPGWARGPTPAPRPDWLSALDGQWPAAAPAKVTKAVEAKVGAALAEKAPGASAEALRAATLDSLRAIMMIRAYRVRGHLAANLDPLGFERTIPTHDELDPATYGFTESDYDRPIFLDYVLGLETGTVREILAILKRTYCGTLGVQYMHISNPTEKAWLQARIEGQDKEIRFTAEGKVAILKKLIEGEGFERFLHKRFPGTKRFGLDGGGGHGAGAGADHQARRRAGRGRDHRRHASPRSPERLGRRDGQAVQDHLPRVPGRLLGAERHRGLGRREISPGRQLGPRVRRQQRAPVADREPQPPRDRQPGGARQGARQADLRSAGEQGLHRLQGDAAPAARRRRLCGPGRGGRVLHAVGHRGLRDARHRSTSSSTTRSASPPRRASAAARPTLRTPR